jgi:ribonuclease HII
MLQMNLAGVDEAGRGPVIGPLVIAGVVLAEEEIDKLVNLGLVDSKLLPKEKREELYDLIIKAAIDYRIEVITAAEIDEKQKNVINLNRLELEKMISVLQTVKNWSKAFVDACDRNEKRFQQRLQVNFSNQIVAEHFADLTYPIVAAASILAKVTRDRIIEEYHNEYNVDFGSGYPHDPKTNKFLESYYSQNNSFPIIVRKSWMTTNKIIAKKQQTKLDSFFKEKP